MPPDGVMNAQYARDRKRKHHLIFRLRARALAAIAAYDRHRFSTTPPSILDLGAADGRALLELVEGIAASEAVGIEYAQSLISEAGPLPETVRLMQGDLTNLGHLVPDEHFDLVTALAVLEHLDDPADVLSATRAKLKPGGLLVATAPSPFWDRLSGGLGLHPAEHHETHFDEEVFARLANEAGLETIEYERFMFAPVAFLPYLRLPVTARFAASVDGVAGSIPLVNRLCVNQLFVARRPA